MTARISVLAFFLVCGSSVALAQDATPLSSLPGSELIDPVDCADDAGTVAAPALVPVPVQAVVLDPSLNPSGFFASIYAAGKGGQWRILILLVLVGLVWAARTLGGGVMPWLKTDRGGAVLALLAGITGTLASMALAGGAFSVSSILDGIVAGFTAAGGWSVVKKLIGDKAKV